MTDWAELLSHLAAASRENGSVELLATAQWLAETLRQTGAQVSLVDVLVHPWRLRAVGVVSLVAALVYVALLWRRRCVGALAVALLVPAVLVLTFEELVVWPGGVTEQHVVARVAPSEPPTQRLVLVAHYDTKTDWLDHVERAPFDLLLLPVIGLQVFAAAMRGRRRWLTVAAGVGAAVQGVGTFCALTAGAWARPSHGALDDGAACAVLVRLTEEFRQSPLQHTELIVAFVAAEELGVEGTARWLDTQRFDDLPTRAINLEALGASDRFEVMSAERFVVRSYAPDPAVVAWLDASARKLGFGSVPPTWYPAATDARSFLAHGIPAATLISVPANGALHRHLHSAADTRARVSVAGLDAAASMLGGAVRLADAEPASPPTR